MYCNFYPTNYNFYLGYIFLLKIHFFNLSHICIGLASEDCVMLIGASRCPWECEQKGLMLTYQKMLMLPMPDYSFRCNLWKELIISKGGQITKYSDRFDVSSLSKISEGMYVKEDIQLDFFFLKFLHDDV